MGLCLCKGDAEDMSVADVYSAAALPPTPRTPRVSKAVDSKLVDQLVLETLSLLASFVDNDQESPVTLVKLHVIADKEDGWIQVVTSMVNVIPLQDSFGPSAISILLDDCPLPSKDTVLKVLKMFNLSSERASTGELNVRVERNICVLLGCIAEKLAGPNSVAVLNEATLDYLLASLANRREPCIVLFALIALEKFAATTENKLNIKAKLDKESPLPRLAALADSDDLGWRQVGFCAQYALDNLFVVPDRPYSYELVDLTGVNAVLNSRDTTEYLKISPDGLEARCDSHSFESVRCTYQVDKGCWYYECCIVTPGVMQIGWATKNSHYLNHDGLGIGDDVYSISYDGCRRLTWYGARPTQSPLPAWKAGDTLGVLIDLPNKEVQFSLNGVGAPPTSAIFDSTRFGFFAAASFMAFQQCRFNFGREPFRFPPKRTFAAFNDYGVLTESEKQVLPRALRLDRLRSTVVRDDACPLCCDRVATCRLLPCGHGGFCPICTAQLRECPMCRGAILCVAEEREA